MKQRVISGFFIILVTLATVLLGKYLFLPMCLFICFQGSKEYANCIKKDNNILLFVILLASSVCVLFFQKQEVEILLVELLILLSIAVFDEAISYSDVTSLFLFSVLLGNGVYYMNYFESISMWLMGYLILICYVTDACAYFVGSLFGKHKFIERVSPHKTIEGAVGGWVLASIAAIVFASIFHYFGFEPYKIIILSVGMPICSQIGDLVFSLIKRNYGIKDYSNLIPGHGGILDRLDSLLFVTLFFGAIIGLLG